MYESEPCWCKIWKISSTSKTLKNLYVPKFNAMVLSRPSFLKSLSRLQSLSQLCIDCFLWHLSLSAQEVRSSMSFTLWHSSGLASMAKDFTASRMGLKPVHRQVLLPKDLSSCASVRCLSCRLQITLMTLVTRP